ncbi:MAG: GAF domain-containing protein [Pseudonocardia sp.]|nr:GAF domain-containing protein [Pseudonocardia sp.]
MDDGGWLELLLSEAPMSEFERLRTSRSRRADANSDREAVAALRIRALLAERRRQATELAALNDIAGQLTTLTGGSLADLLDDIVVQAKRLLGADLAYVALLDGDRLTIEVASGALTPRLVGTSISIQHSLAGVVLERGEPVWTHDYRGSAFARHASADSVARAERYGGLLGVPLRIQRHLLGVLFAGRRREHHYTDDEIALLTALAAHAAVAIDNRRSVERYEETLARLNEVNAELARRTGELERMLRWDRTLTQVVLDGGDGRELLRQVSAIAGRSVRFVPAERLADMALDGLDVELPVEVESPDGRLVAHPVVAGRRRLGALVAEADPDGSLLRRLLERAAPSVALALVGERAVAEATRRATDAFFVDLVSRPAEEPRALARQVLLAGLDPATDYWVLVAQPTTDVSSRGRPLRGLPPGTVVVDQGTGTTVLLPAGGGAPTMERWRRWFGPATVGASGPCRGGVEIAQGYREARQVVDALRALGRDGVLATADELGIYRILLSATGRRQLRDSVDKALEPVLAEQKRRGVPLVDTLEAFLEHSCRHAATSAALGVHVNTLYQRLETITRALGPGWREPGRRFELQLMLRLRRQIANG